MEKNSKGLAIASLVLGIISLVMSVIAVLWIPAILGFVISVIGLVLAIVARKNGNVGGLSTGGLVTNIIGLVLCAVFSVACAAAFFAANSFYHSSDFSSTINSIGSMISDFASGE